MYILLTYLFTYLYL